MRQPTPDWIAAAVQAFAHGHRDDANWVGSQRERAGDLGFGWIYFALARAGEAERVLVQGTGRGFSAACLALAIAHRPDSQVTILDPGYREWLVDGALKDEAAGIWTDDDQVRRHFAPLGLTNIRLLRERSDEGYAKLREGNARFDIILIDGDHAYDQCLRDVRNAVALLRPGGLILLHDACCPDWPGVARAIDTLQGEDATLEKVVLPIYPGVCILQKTRAAETRRIAGRPALSLSALVEQRTRHSIQHMRGELAEKDAVIAGLQAQLRTLQRSRSWRWMRPVRGLMSQMRRMRAL